MSIKISPAGSKYFFVLSLLILLVEYVKLQERTPFLVAICDQRNRVFCFGALIRHTWVVASPDCSIKYMTSEKISIHAGNMKMLCKSANFVDDSLEIHFTKPEKKVYLTFFHLSQGFPINQDIEAINPTEKGKLKSIGDVCEVYSYPYAINSSQAIWQGKNTDKTGASYKYRSDKVHIYEATIISCGRYSEYLCAEIDEDVDINNSPVNCQKKLLGIIWAGGSMPNMILYTPKHLLNQFIQIRLRANHSDEFQPISLLTYLSISLLISLCIRRKM
ncbi:hypothetical protein Trydic_g23229 [Trypoxylus dichotomus]